MPTPSADHLPSSIEWRVLLSDVWAQAGRRLLREIGTDVTSAVDLGCGPQGWLALLKERWPSAQVVGVDADERSLDHARRTVIGDGHAGVELRLEDLFTSTLPDASFDLVHARAMLSTLGWAQSQLSEFLRLIRAGGTLVVEEPDTTTFQPPAGTTAIAELLDLIREGWCRRGLEFDAGRELPELLAEHDLPFTIRPTQIALPPGHPCRLLPMVLAIEHRRDLAVLIDDDALDALVAAALTDARRHRTWSPSMVLVQAWATSPDENGP